MLSETKLQSGGKVDESRHVSSQILRQHRRKEKTCSQSVCISNVEPLCPFITMALLIIFPHYFPHMITPSPKHANGWPSPCHTSNDLSQAFWFQSVQGLLPLCPLRIVRPTHPCLPRTFMIWFYFYLLFYWCIVAALQCCASFCRTMKSIGDIYTHVYFFLLGPPLYTHHFTHLGQETCEKMINITNY